MLDALEDARRTIADRLAAADPDRVTASQAAKVMALFAEIERLGAAGKVLFSRRAADSTVWRDEGHRSAAAWMAETTGTALGDALAVLDTAGALAGLPETTEALRRGELSAPQVKVIAAAATQHPSAERDLLDTAARQSLKALKERAALVRAAATSAQEEAARYLAIHRRRSLRHWADPDGALRLEARLTPDAGAKLLSILQAEADARFAQARQAGESEPPGAYRADALVALVTGEAITKDSSSKDSSSKGSRPGPRATVCIRVDAAALERGYVQDGETCAIAGVGPVPVAAVRRQLSDAFVKILVHRGRDVTTVCHVGRSVPAHVQSALDERDPRCVVPGCDTALGLENHHWDVPYAQCGTSTLAGLARVCSWHHGLLTYEGYVLTSGAGAWQWRAPPGGCSFETGAPLLDTG